MSSQNQNKTNQQQQNPNQKPGQQQGGGGKKPGQQFDDKIDPNNPQGNENTEYSGGT